MNQRTQPRAVPGTQPPSSWRPRAEARGSRLAARGSSEARQPRLVPPPRLVSPAPRRLTFPGLPLPPSLRSAAASAGPGGLAPVAASDSTERAPNRAQLKAPLPGPRGRREASTAAEQERGRGGAGLGGERGPPGSRGGAPPPPPQARGGGGARRRRGTGSDPSGEEQPRRGLAGRSVGPSLFPSPPLAAGGGGDGGGGGRAPRSAPALLALGRHGLVRSPRQALALCLHPPRRRTFK